MTGRRWTSGLLAAGLVMGLAAPAMATTPPSSTTTSTPGAVTTTTAVRAPAPTTTSSTPGSPPSPPSTSTTSTVPGLGVGFPAGPPTPLPPFAPPDLRTPIALPPELPPGEAQLLGLIETTDARVAALDGELSLLKGQLAGNAGQLAQAKHDLAARQGAAIAASASVTSLNASIADLRAQMRRQAAADYVHPVAGQIINLIVRIQDPAELTNVAGYYHALVDGMVRDVAHLKKLGKAAAAAEHAATTARDQATRQLKSVQSQQASMTTLSATLETVRGQSLTQANQQQTLLAEANARRAEFTALIAIQSQQSTDIASLLRAAMPTGDAAGLPGAIFNFPVPGAPITSPFGPRLDPLGGPPGFHPGVDFGARMGTPILAAGDGIVLFAGEEGGYGNFTCLQHPHGLATCYAHQSVIIVKVGDKVTQGQVIGLIGTTGYSTGPHLHFEVRVGGQVTDPMPFLIPLKPSH